VRFRTLVEECASQREFLSEKSWHVLSIRAVIALDSRIACCVHRLLFPYSIPSLHLDIFRNMSASIASECNEVKEWVHVVCASLKARLTRTGNMTIASFDGTAKVMICRPFIKDCSSPISRVPTGYCDQRRVQAVVRAIRKVSLSKDSIETNAQISNLARRKA
jgi:hypothetical protein